MIRFAVLALVLSALTLTGCIAVGGNSSNQVPTQGQQLTDLKTALDRGAITQAEYDQKKSQILAQK